MRNVLFLVILIISFTLSETAVFAWECDIEISGPEGVPLGQSITLRAEGDPDGGSYSWSRTPNLQPNGSSAILTGFMPEFSDYIKVIGYYTTPKGKTCSAVKWIWPCPCGVAINNAPTETMVGEEISLTASSQEPGGTFQWSISEGSGSINPTDNSATVIADTPGELTIEVDYTPAGGGSSCKDSHTLTVVEECAVTISAEPSQVPLGGTIKLTATGTPVDGIWDWTPMDGLTPTANTANFIPATAGQHTLVAKYTTTGGTTCEAEQTVTAYKVHSLTSKNACYTSGDSITLDDFTVQTSPVGYEAAISLIPSTLSTIFQTQEVTVTGSCGEGTLDDAETTVIVVNGSNPSDQLSIKVEIPNTLSDPLKAAGIAEKLDFNLNFKYEQYFECCDNGVMKSIRGETKLKTDIDLENKTVYGVPLPKSLEKYAKITLLECGLSGSMEVNLKNEFKACENNSDWTANGNINLTLEASSEAKVAKSDYLLLKGMVKGTTSLKENISTDINQITAKGTWGALGINGEIIIKIGPIEYVKDLAKHTIFEEKSIPLTLPFKPPNP